MQPRAYPDVRFTAGAVPQSDAEAVAMEQAARLEAAQRAARLAAAKAPAGDKPFTADEADAYVRGQQSMAGVGQMPTPWAQPAAHCAGKGKGKSKQPHAHDADPFLGMVAGGPPKGKGKKGKEGKGKREEGPREPMPCSRCGSFFVCAKTAVEEGKGNGKGHCTNPRCERSLHFALLSPEQQRILLAANLAAKQAAAAEANVAATEAAAAAVAAAALPKDLPAAGAAAWVAGATVVIDDTQPSDPRGCGGSCRALRHGCVLPGWAAHQPGVLGADRRLRQVQGPAHEGPFARQPGIHGRPPPEGTLCRGCGR